MIVVHTFGETSYFGTFYKPSPCEVGLRFAHVMHLTLAVAFDEVVPTSRKSASRKTENTLESLSS